MRLPVLNPLFINQLPDKAAHRIEMGLQPDWFIVGTVMRNQKRKLFFELMKSFRLFLDRAPPEIAAKSYLYLHTSYPERDRLEYCKWYNAKRLRRQGSYDLHLS